MVREQDAVFVLGPIVDFATTFVRAGLGHLTPESAKATASAAEASRRRGARRALKKDALRIAISGCLAFAIGFVPQLLAYNALNGRFGPSRLVTRKMNWLSPHALEVIGSPEHGFFIWTPLAALAILGLVVLAVRGSASVRRIAWCALLMVALQIYVSGSVESWTVAGAFGQRRFVALTILLTIGLAGFLAAVPRGGWRPLTGTLIALCVWWNVALIAAFGTGLMDRQRLELRRNAYDAFVTLPRMLPELAYRYFADRDSFYRRVPSADAR
jgi:hypothetical protein